MANTHQTGIKKDDHGGSSRDQQPQAASVAPDQLRAGVKGDDHGDDVETTSMLKNCKKNSAPDGGGRSSMIEILRRGAESVTLRHDDDPLHPSLPEPEGVQFVLHTLPVKKDCIGDGDGFTAYVKKVVGVAVSGSYKKGDTNNRPPQQYRIRMRGIDAPELKMKYGAETRNELVKLIGGKCVTIHVYGMDQYERYLGDIYCDGIFIQEEMLKRGFAWYFKTGEKRPELARWEREAREARQGLWSLDNPQKPWEWKRDHPRNNKKEAANDIQSLLQNADAPPYAPLGVIRSDGKGEWEASGDRATGWQHSDLAMVAPASGQVNDDDELQGLDLLQAQVVHALRQSEGDGDGTLLA